MRVRWVVLTLLAAIGGCLVPPDPDSISSDKIETDLLDPQAIIAAYQQALNKRDVQAYAALLEAPAPGTLGFQFRPIARIDLGDFPWLTEWLSEPWSRGTEILAIERLFDPGFEGSVVPVSAIVADLSVLSVVPEGGYTRVLFDASIRLQRSPGPDRVTETRFEIVLVGDSQGFLRIREMEEINTGQSVTWSWLKIEYMIA